MKDDTIGAISTPPGSGGIGIIRVSGPAAAETVDRIFASKRKNSDNYCIRTAHEVVRMSAFTLKHGYIFDPDSFGGADGVPEFVDECLVSVMRAPRSYTGEDVVEINTHGGTAVMKRVLGILFRLGVRPAEPGEFTKRAFLNGRIDLAQAEAVAELIRAKTEAGRKAAMEQMTGALGELVRKHSENIEATLARFEVAIDYPEYDEDHEIVAEAMASLETTGAALRELAATYEHGRLVREGLRVAISGRPNAGKSSLMNGILGFGRAIVTDIPGTTRDTLEEALEIRGYPVILTDTAGLRDSDDPVEAIGVERARAELRRADVVIFLIDAAGDIDGDLKLFEELRGEIGDKYCVAALNKTDLLSDAELAARKAALAARFGGKKAASEATEVPETGADESKSAAAAAETGADEIKNAPSAAKTGADDGTTTLLPSEFVCISVKNGGAEVITGILAAYLERFGAGSGGALITAERHKQLVDRAIAAIDRARASANADMPLDIISYDIWECAEALGEITGRNVTDEVIDTIFSKFCLGK